MNIKTIITRGVLGAAALAALALPVVATGQADASTPGCTTGVYAGYCGTQTDAEGPAALSFDVFRQSAKVNTPIIGFPNSNTDPATDFFTFAYQGGTTKVFEYAPNGRASGLCISEPSAQAGLVLRGCNGSAFQRFTPKAITDPALPSAPPTFTWANVESGDIIAAHGRAAQLTGVLAPGAVPPATERWTFSG